MEELFESREDLGKVLESYQRIAVSLNGFQENQSISVNELAGSARVHWSTAKKALLFFDAIKTIIPDFELSPDARMKFRIIAKSSAFKAVKSIFGSLEMRVLTKMMLCRAMDPENARSFKEVLEPQEFEVLPELISRGFVNSLEGLYYLSRRGISIGGLGLKKLIDSGIQLPWQKTSVVLPRPAIFISPRKVGGEIVCRPVYPSHLYSDSSVDGLGEWQVGQK